MTEEIKKAFEIAASDEEKKAVFDKYKDTIKALTEDELKDVTGGLSLNYVMGLSEPNSLVANVCRPC